MSARILPPDTGPAFDFGGFGVRWKIDGPDTGGRFAVVHHPIAPRTLAAPLHRHYREDEFSFVLTGTMGALLGEDVVTAGPGTWVFKPRHQWHTFWNDGDSPCEIIEIISPPGFEDYFRDFSKVWPGRTKAASIREKYGLDMDLDSTPALCARFGLVPA